eukprot:7670705-Pyramimonas_sp.AAC.1
MYAQARRACLGEYTSKSEIRSRRSGAWSDDAKISYQRVVAKTVSNCVYQPCWNTNALGDVSRSVESICLDHLRSIWSWNKSKNSIVDIGLINA